MFQRHQYQTLASRLENEPRRFVQVLFGPRQSGKTTLVTQFTQQTHQLTHYAAADAVSISGQTWISQQWSIARLKLKQSTGKVVVLILDEIQKIENWSESVKLEWDSDTRNAINLKVVLLGSSRLLLQQGLTESMAGRFETIYMGHWSFDEMQTAFDFSPEQFVWFGGYPGATTLMDDESRWRQFVSDALIETSISKDILMLTAVAKPALIRRLFEIGCHYSGQILSYTKMLGQLADAGNTTTLANYLRLLDTAGLLGGIQKYSPRLIRQRASSPKFMVHNTALITAQQNQPFQTILSNPEQWGRWVESAVGAHLLNSSISSSFKLYYWRDRGDEIDFVMSVDDRIIGLEVKSGRTQTSSGMAAFGKQFSPDKTYLIGDTGLPWQEFLSLDPMELF
ncbi:MAG: AAA family ATPase [Candidatus Marinimicrobia bacterium CG1_02_48_14]|nr:MAG: AAA family ATPase [Candidatus Marinimicrobia bacterium CG1_02_48_14]